MNSIFKNALYNTIYKILNVLFPAVILSYVSHVLLPESLGKVANAQNITQYFVMIAPLGLVNYGPKEIAGSRYENSKRDITFSELFFINSISTTICCITYYTLIFLGPFSVERKMLLSVTGLALVFNYLNVEWFFQGVEEFKYITIRSLCVKVISLLLIVLFVHTKSDYLIYALIYTLGIAGNNVFNVIRLRRIGVRIHREELCIRVHLKPLLFLVMNSIAVELYTLIDVTMLGLLCDDRTVAYYSNSQKIIRVVVTVITASCGVLMPRLSLYKDREMNGENRDIINKAVVFVQYVALPSVVGMTLLAEPIVTVLFGGDFIPAATVLQLGSMLILAMGYSYLFGTQVMITYNMENRILLCSIIGAVSNIIGNTILIPLYRQNGAIIASVISELLVMITTFLFAKRVINIRMHFCKFIYAALGCLAMGIVIVVIQLWVTNNLMTIIISGICGILVYFVVVLILDKKLRLIVKHRFTGSH